MLHESEPYLFHRIMHLYHTPPLTKVSSNNIAEYEAVITRLVLELQITIANLTIYGLLPIDSRANVERIQCEEGRTDPYQRHEKITHKTRGSENTPCSSSHECSERWISRTENFSLHSKQDVCHIVVVGRKLLTPFPETLSGVES